MTTTATPAAIETLKREHVYISRVIAVMEDQARAIDEGVLPRPELIYLIAGFFSTFADRRHHGKEERYLFPLIADKKQIIRDGPVKVLTAEHESGRYFVTEMRQGIEQLKGGDLAAAARLSQAMTLYARMLRKHIIKEEEIVFLLTESLLSDDEMSAMSDEFTEADKASGDADLEKTGDLVLRIEELNRSPLEGAPTRYPAAS